MLLRKIIKITKNEEKAIYYLIKKKILPSEKHCHRCKSKMILDFTLKAFRCQKKDTI
ncbi:hypothetical protein H312_01394 [Anncaliia algerae PRA339]|uniref:Uncharacterized protein n=1 Tax=Anncaliia algerae PRA339 TaxID=1288291 RepID=A0A059F2G6_9MICR|nr:hypothetical protein H312_01394 [Anncaliia algerae PRA339]